MQVIKIKHWLTIMVLAAASLIITSCDKQPVGPTGPDPVAPGTYMPISQFRALYTGTTDVTIPAGTKKIWGKVISNSANEAAGNFRLQDESGAGIYLYSQIGSPVYKPGDVLEIDATGGGVLTMFNGDLELKNVPIANVNVIPGANLNPVPRVATTQKVIDSLQKWSSTLVTLTHVTITKGISNSTGQNYNIVDATGSIVSFVRTTSGIVLPEGVADSLTGYISIYQPGTSAAVAQLTVRTAADVVNGGQGGGTGGSSITLTTSPYNIDFNNIGISLPTGVTVVTGASATNAGTSTTVTTSPQSSLWKATGGGFKNYASATGLNLGSDSAAQVTSTNRALGIRQTGSIGDPGGAFVFLITNTTGKNNLKMDFQLQSLDTSSSVTRTATWSVDYALGDNPTTFIAAAPTGTMTTGNKVFSNNSISVTLPAAVNNQSQKLWVRIVTLSATSGSSNRPSTAIDDVKFTWN